MGERHTQAAAGPGGDGKDPGSAGGHGRRGRAAPDPDRPRAALPQHGAPALRHRRQPGVPLRRGALLHPAGQPGVLRVRRFSRPGAGRGGRLLLLCAALKSVAPELRVYQRPSRKPAFLSGLLATVDELKTCRITPEQLWTAGEESGGGEGTSCGTSLSSTALRGHDRPPGADPRDRLTRLAEALTREDWAVGKDFYLDAFTDFTPRSGQCSPPCWGRPIPSPWPLTCDKLEEDEGGAGIFSPPAAPPASSSGWPRSGAFPGKLRCAPAGRTQDGGPGPSGGASSSPPARPL